MSVSADCVKKISARVAAGDWEAALSSIASLVNRIFCEPSNTARVFSSKTLDGYCQKIGAEVRREAEADAGRTRSAASSSGADAVFIASTLYASGGHTAVIADLARLSPSVKVVVLLTGMGGTTEQKSIDGRFSGLPNVSFERAPKGGLLGKLLWLQGRLSDLRPRDVWLFNHHHDSVAVASVQPDCGYRLHFYHHGDHHLCLGVHLEYADHIDPHPMGFHNCREALGVKDNRYLPLVVKDLGDAAPLSPPRCAAGAKAGLITCTAAGFNKISVPYIISYADVIPELLRVSGGKHIHIGRLSPAYIRRIRCKMKALGVNDEAFEYIPYVSSVWTALRERKVDLYLTSFPYGGARTLIEAMGAGVAIALHSHAFHRLLSTIDMAYDQAFVWRDPQELYDFVKGLNPDVLAEHGRLARAHYEAFHREDGMRDALSSFKAAQSPPLRAGYVADNLLQAIDAMRQSGCLAAIKRELYARVREWKWKGYWI